MNLPLALARAASRLPRGGSPIVRTLAEAFPSLRSIWLPSEYGDVFCDLRERLCFPLLKYGRFPHWADDRAFFAEWALAPGKIIFDVGANLGLTARLFARNGATVHAFEPSARALRMLRRNVAETPTIVIHPVAIAASSGTVHLHEHDALDRSAITAAGGTDVSIAVEAITLDSLGIIPDLLKIDVEGFEEEVLQGAMAILTAGTPVFFEALDPASLARSAAIMQRAHPGYRITRIGATDNYLAKVERA